MDHVRINKCIINDEICLYALIILAIVFSCHHHGEARWAELDIAVLMPEYSLARTVDDIAVLMPEYSLARTVDDIAVLMPEYSLAQAVDDNNNNNKSICIAADQ